jgi:hypothetical protein
MRKTTLNVIMGLILAGSTAIAYFSETPSEMAGWTVAALTAAIFLVDQIGPKD